MPDVLQKTSSATELTDQSKTISLFQFIRELNKLKQKAMLKAKARELMVQCQKAVPCWIMPINKALESLDPRANRFDIIIIDEASQSDVSSLAILYMGKKLVIVGDDRQVSPMAVGVEDKKISSLQEQYIKDKMGHLQQGFQRVN